MSMFCKCTCTPVPHSLPQALEGRSPESLRSEVLVGVDPVSRLASAVRSAINAPPPTASLAPDASGNAGSDGTTALPQAGVPGIGAGAGPQGAAAAVPSRLATVCSDWQGGALIGLKWTAAAFMPQQAEVR